MFAAAMLLNVPKTLRNMPLKLKIQISTNSNLCACNCFSSCGNDTHVQAVFCFTKVNHILLSQASLPSSLAPQRMYFVCVCVCVWQLCTDDP